MRGAVVLLTRPLARSQAFAASLRRAAPGIAVTIAPLLRIVPVAHDAAALRAAAGLVFTSAEAVPAAAPGRGRVALCVGEATAAAARAAGFAVTVGCGDAEGLLELIAASPVALIHPHGRHLSRVLPVPGMVVYDQRAEPPSAAALSLLGGEGAVVLPLFSPRSARLAAAMAEGARAALWPVAFSPAVASGWGTGPISIAERPDPAAMQAAVLRVWAAAGGPERSPAEPG